MGKDFEAALYLSAFQGLKDDQKITHTQAWFSCQSLSLLHTHRRKREKSKNSGLIVNPKMTSPRKRGRLTAGL